MRWCTDTWVLDKQSVTRGDVTGCDRVEGLWSVGKFSWSSEKDRSPSYSKKKMKSLCYDKR